MVGLQLLAGCWLLTRGMASVGRSAKIGQKNVLMIVVDDLRPEIASLGGSPLLHTPNLDALVKMDGSVAFERAYVQQAICCPSRTSFLTGRRPDTTKVWDLKTSWRGPMGGGNFTTLPQYLKQNGYKTAGGGKIFHPAPGVNDDVPLSWTEPYFQPSVQANHAFSNLTHAWWAVPNDVAWQDLPDGQITVNALKQIEDLAPSQGEKDPSPFFIAVGLHRPHLPFVAPQRFFDLYPLQDIGVVCNKQPPADWGPAEDYAWDASSGPRHCGTGAGDPLEGDIKALNLTRFQLLPDVTALQMRRAYYACVSFADFLVGQLLQKLDTLQLTDDTLIVFVGDHGWHLGEHGTFGKKTNFEIGVRAPMVIRDPQYKGRVAATCGALVEFVDLFATVVDSVAAPPLPLCPPDSHYVLACTEGTSLRPLLEAPSTQAAQFKSAVFHQYPPCMHDDMVWHDACQQATEPEMMGYSIRTDTQHYTEWVRFDKNSSTPLWSQLLGSELYLHPSNPSSTSTQVPDENENLANHSKYADTVKELSRALHRGWRLVAEHKE